ncbi:hypothetical protein V6N13_129259 [Hibiscus sabdariffa]
MKIGKNLKTGLEWSLSSWKSSNDPSSGSIQRLLWTESSAWTILYASPTNECENYGKCGVNGICRLSISSKATLVTCFQKPGFFTGKSSEADIAALNNAELPTVNEVTITTLGGR